MAAIVEFEGWLLRDGDDRAGESALACGSPVKCTAYPGVCTSCPLPFSDTDVAPSALSSALRAVASTVRSRLELLLLPGAAPFVFGAGIVPTELERDRVDVDPGVRGAVWKDAFVDTMLERREASSASDWVARTSVAIEVD